MNVIPVGGKPLVREMFGEGLPVATTWKLLPWLIAKFAVELLVNAGGTLKVAELLVVLEAGLPWLTTTR